MSDDNIAPAGDGRKGAIYLNDWAESGQAGMLEDFGITADALAGANVLVASYTYEDYNGDAYVLFERDGKLWEVHGSHCSCYGLSERDYCGDARTQWEPEETTVEAVLHTANSGSWGEEGKVKEAIRAILARIDGGHHG